MSRDEDTGRRDADPTNLRLGEVYVAAWGEVDFRIAQRQNALQIYVTLASALIAVMFTGHILEKSGLGPQVFSILLPAVSLAFVALNYKHERTIGLLRQYLLECELSTPSLQGYHRGNYYLDALRVRRYHDRAAAALVAMFNAFGFIVARASFEGSFDLLGWPAFVYVVVTGWVVYSILTAAKADELKFRATLNTSLRVGSNGNQGPMT